MKKQVKLLNVSISIKKEIGENGSFYYVITDKDNQEKYICFRKIVTEGWVDLIDCWFEIEAVNIEYQPTSLVNIVTKFYSLQKTETLYEVYQPKK